MQALLLLLQHRRGILCDRQACRGCEAQEAARRFPDKPQLPLACGAGVKAMEEQAREGRKREEQKLKAQLRMVVAYW